MEEKQEKTIKQKPTGDAKNETMEEVTVRQTGETEVVADEVSEDTAKKPTKAKRNGQRRRSNKEGTKRDNTSKIHETGKADAEGEKEETPGNEHDSSNKALELELERQQAMLEEANERYKRLLAEFENARNRYEKESKHMYDIGAKEVLEKLLPVVDNFERALQTVSEEDKERAFEQGVDKIYKQLMITLEEVGVKPMNAEGTQFDPNLHNAVLHVEDDTLDENIVAEELQKGYLYKEDVLRHSMVKVAN